MNRNYSCFTAIVAALVVSGCGSDGGASSEHDDAIALSEESGDSISPDDAIAIANNFKCSQAAKFFMRLASNAEINSRLKNVIAEPMIRTNAYLSAHHQFSNLQYIRKYGQTSRDRINKIAKESGDEFLSEVESAGGKSEQFDYIALYLKNNCGGVDLFTKNNNKTMNSEGDKRIFDQIYEDTLAETR